jgi:prepilin-type N-terminal cleavage/methylation domain-containing protein
MNKLNNNLGFSMIELVVVMVILALGILPLAAVQTQSHRDVFETGQHAEALYIAQAQMETVRNLGFANAVTDSGVVAVYTWRTNINNVSLGLNSVRVSVQWNEKGQPQSVVLSDLLSFR